MNWFWWCVHWGCAHWYRRTICYLWLYSAATNRVQFHSFWTVDVSRIWQRGSLSSVVSPVRTSSFPSNLANHRVGWLRQYSFWRARISVHPCTPAFWSLVKECVKFMLFFTHFYFLFYSVLIFVCLLLSQFLEFLRSSLDRGFSWFSIQMLGTSNWP
jgi:hypothetical protein